MVIDYLGGLFSSDLGMDLGTANSLIYVKDKGIVIETMPTSNVTIGHHHSYKSYHLLTWLKWKQEGVDVPDIVLGSDETGVFPANIANEYANVLELLRTDGTIENPEKVVESIIEMSSSKVFSKLN